MDLVTCAGSFLLGGVSAIILMGLLLLFIESPLNKTKEEHHLKRIALSLLPLTESKNAEEMPRSRDGAALRALKSQSVKGRFSLAQNAVAGRWGKVYTPVSEPLQ
jgi:hypothetical protein